MNNLCKTLACALAAALLGGCMPALAAVPLRWTVETSRAAPQRFDVYRGETLSLAADLTSYGHPLALAGEAALYVQTNGMGNAWWTVPATVSSNRLEATLSPTNYPAGATLLNCYLGGPATSYRAAFQARILGAPGPAPNTVLPPVVTLDFNALAVANAPYYTKDEADARYGGASITATVVTNIAAAVVSRDLAPYALKSDVNSATNALEFALRYGMMTGTGAIYGSYYAQGDDSNYGLAWDGATWRYIRYGEGWSTQGTELARMDDIASASFVARSGGTATNLTVIGDSLEIKKSGSSPSSETVWIEPANARITIGESGVNAVSLSHTGFSVYDTGGQRDIAFPASEGTIALVENIKTGYEPRAGTAVVALSQSVQKVTVTGLASLAIQLPNVANDTVGDFVVYTVNTATDAVPLAFPAGNYYAADASVTNALAQGVTALYFTEISHGVWAIARQELQLVTVEQ